MNADIKKLWVAALTDGSYTQGTKALRYGSTFCCLGVLCDLHSKATGQTWHGDSRPEFNMTYDGNVAELSNRVRVWAGLDEPDPWVQSDGERRTLASFNDGHKTRKHSFIEIAKLIEDQL